MKFYSTRDRIKKVSLKEAVLNGMPEDGGLYMPEHIPVLEKSFFETIKELSLKEIAKKVAREFLDDIPHHIIDEIVEEAINFDAPVKIVSDKIAVVELFHGPTLAFKDFGARFMSRLMAYFIKDTGKKLNVLVATSGDTGSAVASGFYKAPNINVILLYPSGKVSTIQEKQLTTMGNNIIPLEVDGNFDDCQRLVKTAFVDKELNSKIMLTSANSINIARLIPQSFYYFYAYAQLKERNKSLVISVPSGNLGNLTGGVITKKMGLPVYKFIASTNANSTFTDYLRTGEFKKRDTIKTISNAMDVGNPSNFERLQDIYNHNVEDMRKDIRSFTFTDKGTIEAIKEFHNKYQYTLDPHGAVGYLGLKKFIDENSEKSLMGVFLETAHPAKFLDIVESAIEKKISIPERLEKFLSSRKKSIKVSREYNDFKKFLIDVRTETED